MSMRRMGLLGLTVMLVLGAAAVLCPADEPKKADADKAKEMTAEEKDAALADIALAYEIAGAGRKAGSPEALLAAAKILARLNGQEIGLLKVEGVQPVTGKANEKPKNGEPIKEEGGKPVSFADAIKKLKDDARKLNKNPENPDLAKLIDAVDEGTRGSIHGPESFGPFDLGGNDSKTFTFNFVGKTPARVSVSSTDGTDVQMLIYNPDGVLIGSRTGPNVEIHWTPAATKPFQVLVSGTGSDTGFTIFKN